MIFGSVKRSEDGTYLTISGKFKGFTKNNDSTVYLDVDTSFGLRHVRINGIYQEASIDNLIKLEDNIKFNIPCQTTRNALSHNYNKTLMTISDCVNSHNPYVIELDRISVNNHPIKF